MKKRRFPRNPDCPLTKTERFLLCKLMDKLEWQEYYPMKHISGAFADVKVYRYDEETINAELKWGIEGQGDSVVHTSNISINRFEMTVIS